MVKLTNVLSFWLGLILIASSFWVNNALFTGLALIVFSYFEVVTKNQEILNDKLDTAHKNSKNLHNNILVIYNILEKKNV